MLFVTVNSEKVDTKQKHPAFVHSVLIDPRHTAYLDGMIATGTLLHSDDQQPQLGLKIHE